MKTNSIHYYFAFLILLIFSGCESDEYETKINQHQRWRASDIRITYLVRGSDGNGNQFLESYKELVYPDGVLELIDTNAVVSNVIDEITQLMIITFLDENGEVTKPVESDLGLYHEIVMGNFQHQLRREYAWGMNGRLISLNSTFTTDISELEKDKLFLSMVSNNTLVHDNPYTIRAILTPY